MGNTEKYSKQWKRGTGFHPLELSCGYVLRHLFQTKNFLYSKMAHDWSGIVGSEIASVTRPCRIQVFKNEGTLWMEVDVSGSLWIPAHSSTLIERVNQYMGYKAIARVVFRKTYIHSPSIFNAPKDFSSVTRAEKFSENDILCQKIYQKTPNLQLLASTPLGEALMKLAFEMKIWV
ncbi:DUF721 domain-containing protein [Holospora curviuscula]|uniref:DUF721 domain-containing protein n=1 Tax=Holospora curviuscula TaxID=1082868 RepID=A0A2S5R6P8_9PROT|nr:DUF721 domain-containing protein [Holospora curviuscula]PPE03009.1 hypothetical protein HCUR_01550 [Holospora curviuscula]